MNIRLYKLYKGDSPTSSNLPKAIGRSNNEVGAIFLLATDKGQFHQAINQVRETKILIKDECNLFYGKYRKERGKEQSVAMFSAMRARDQGYGKATLAAAGGSVADVSGNSKVDTAMNAGATLIQAVGDPIGTVVGFGVEKLLIASDYAQKFYFYGVTIASDSTKVFNKQYRSKHLATIQKGTTTGFGSLLAKYVATATGLQWTDVVIKDAGANDNNAPVTNNYGPMFEVWRQGLAAGKTAAQIKAEIAAADELAEMNNAFNHGVPLEKKKKKKWFFKG